MDEKITSEVAPNAGETGADEREESRSPLWRRALKVVLWVIGGVLGLVVALVLILLLVLQTNWGAERAKNLVVGRLNALFDGAELQVGKLDGNFIGRLVLTDVNLVRDDGERMAHVDTLNAAYRLLPLLKNRLHLTDIYLASPHVRMEQRADSTWDLFTVIAQDSASVDTAKSAQTALVIELDYFDLRNGSVQAHFYAPGKDSVLAARNLGIELGDMVFGENLTLRLDTLFTVIEPPGEGDGPINLAIGGALDNGQFTLDGLRLQSPNSNVVGRGLLAMPSDSNRQGRDLDFVLEAKPLAFKDIRAFVPALPAEGSVDMELRVKGAENRIDARADAAFSDGSRVDLTAAITPPGQQPASYRVTGEIRGLDPRFLTGDPAQAGSINADVNVNLAGDAAEEVNGSAGLVVFDSRFGEYRLDRTTLESTFTNGLGRIDLRTGLRGLSLAVNGTVRPFDETPTYDLEGSVRNLNIGRFTEGGQQSRISARFAVEGRGIDAQTADLRGQVTLAPSRINAYEIRSGRLWARLQNSRLTFDTRMTLPEGSIAADGNATFGDQLTYRINRGEIRNLDVAALTGDTTRSRINARFTLTGAGTDPQAMVLRASADVRDSYYGTYTLESVGLRANLRSEVMRLTAAADLGDAGQVNASATVRPFAEVLAFDAPRIQFRHIDVGAFTQNPDQHSDLNGTLALRGRGTDPAAMTLNARLDLQPSRVNDQEIERLGMTIGLRRGAVQFDGRLTLPEGGITLAGQARPFDAAPSYTIRRGTFEGLNVGALAGNPDLQTSLNGTLALDGRGIEPKTMHLDARLGFDRSTINDVVLQDGSVQATADQGRIDLTTLLEMEDGAARVNAQADLRPAEPTYSARGVLSRIDVGGLTGADTLDARVSLGFDVAGMGTKPRTMQLAGTVHAAETQYQSLKLDTLGTRFRLAEGVLSLDSLLLRSNLATAHAGGRIALFDTTGTQASDLRFAAEVVSLEPIRPMIAAEVFSLREGRLEGKVSGPSTHLTVEADGALNSLIYNDIRLAGLTLRAEGVLDSSFSVLSGGGRVELNYLATSTMTVRQTAVTAAYDTSEVAFTARSNIDERRDLRVNARMDFQPEGRRLLLDTLGLRIDDQKWALREPTVITYGDAYRVDSLVLYSGDQSIAAHGVIDPNGEQDFRTTIENLRIGGITDLLGYPGLDGTLTTRLELTGPAPDPDLNGVLGLDVLYGDRDAGDLRAVVQYDARRLNLDAAFTHQTGDSLTVKGYLPMDLSLAPADTQTGTGGGVSAEAASGGADLRIVAEQFNIDWVRPFLPPESVSEITGYLDADIHITGSMDNPNLAGEAGFREGRVGLPQLGVVYEDITVDARMDPGAIVVERASLRSGGGTLVIDGQIEVPELTLGAFQLDVALDEFRAIRSEDYQATISGNLDVSGTTAAPVVAGGLRVLSANVYLNNMAGGDIRQVQLTAEDVRMLEEFFGYRVSRQDTTVSDIYNALTLDLGVELERDSWIRQTSNPEMAIQFTGTIELNKQPNEEIQLFRSIEVIPQRSFIRQFGREFNITRGTVTFNGPITEMMMDIGASFYVPSRQNPGQPEATITLSLSGRMDDLKFELGSDPPMSNTNIVSYIATGSPASEAFQLGGGGEGGGGGLLTTGGNLAANQLAGYLEGVAGDELGLDVIEIEQDGLRGTQLVAGKYVTPKLYLGINQPISLTSTSEAAAGTKKTEVTTEYEVFEWLLLQVLSGTSTSAVRLNLTGRYTFR